MLEDTVKVNTAGVEAPGAKLVPSLFQVKVIGPLAEVGLQFEVVMLSVTDAPVPVFLTYMVFVIVFPGVADPQSIEDKATVQALSEYKPRFGDTDIVPVEVRLLFTVTAANVVSVNASPVMTKTTMVVVIGIFSFVTM